MKISVSYIAKNEDNNLRNVISLYDKRIKQYIRFEMIPIGRPRISGNQPATKHKENEGKLIIKGLSNIDFPVLLDVMGRQMNSESFSEFIQHTMNRGIQHLGFIIGGAYGFSDAVYSAVPDKGSLSQMTFSHQLVRLIFLEQLYRALTLMHGEPYHHY